MKTRLSLFIGIIFAASFLFMGCAAKSPEVTSIEVSEVEEPVKLAPAPEPAPVAEKRVPIVLDDITELREGAVYGEVYGIPGLSNTDIYDALFDFDRYSVRQEDVGNLNSNIRILNKYPRASITLQGHCDERGTIEYNIALGSRRADSIKKYLVTAGISADRIKTVSYGKEKPFCLSHDEDCWQKNRRVHFVIRGGN